MENESVMNRKLGISSEKGDLIQTILLGAFVFLVPTFLAQLIAIIFGSTSLIAVNSQLVIGSVVNMILVITAINISGWKKIIGIVTMPSISVILSGYIFGAASIFMLYMIPAIWLGNFVLIYIFKLFMLKKNTNYFLTGAIGIVVKVAIIFGFFEILALLGIFPDKIATVLQSAMSITQLITASIGVVLGYGVYMSEKRKI